MRTERKASFYLQAKVETASPSQLILMLYDELLKTLIQSLELIKLKRIEATHLKLIKAQEIIAELMGSLNLGTGEIAHNLFRIYQYLIGELIQVNIEKNENRLIILVDIVGDLRKAWSDGVLKSDGDKLASVKSV